MPRCRQRWKSGWKGNGRNCAVKFALLKDVLFGMFFFKLLNCYLNYHVALSILFICSIVRSFYKERIHSRDKTTLAVYTWWKGPWKNGTEEQQWLFAHPFRCQFTNFTHLYPPFLSSLTPVPNPFVGRCFSKFRAGRKCESETTTTTRMDVYNLNNWFNSDFLRIY